MEQALYLGNPQASAAQVRRQLFLSQTDVTPDPEQAFTHAVLAYKDALASPTVATTDPTAAGEAAAKAGLHFVRAGLAKPDANAADLLDSAKRQWFDRSFELLPSSNAAAKRERVATYICMIRAHVAAFTANPALLDSRKRVAFAAGLDKPAQNIVSRQHVFATSWDPYATMLDRHTATLETVIGRHGRALQLAARGVWRALHAAEERKNFAPNQPSNQVAFIRKQTAANALAALTAVAGALSSRSTLMANLHQRGVQRLAR